MPCSHTESSACPIVHSRHDGLLWPGLSPSSSPAHTLDTPPALSWRQFPKCSYPFKPLPPWHTVSSPFAPRAPRAPGHPANPSWEITSSQKPSLTTTRPQERVYHSHLCNLPILSNCISMPAVSGRQGALDGICSIKPGWFQYKCPNGGVGKLWAGPLGVMTVGNALIKCKRTHID